MKYISTRGLSPALSFSEILLGGLAPDGGLYLPESYPQFNDADLNAMRDMNYADLAFAILKPLLLKLIPLRFIVLRVQARMRQISHRL
jgi:threonine synthase